MSFDTTSHAAPSTAPSAGAQPETVQLLDPAGVLQENDRTAEFLPTIEALSDETLRQFHRDMVLTRRFDDEAGNLQRQGQLALWVPSHGQEAAQVGSARASRPQDHLFPSYREHAVGMVRGIDPVDVVRLLRGNTHGGWNPAERQNFHLYTLVIGSQTLHATGYALGITLDGDYATGDPERDTAVITYFGDGATSQGDVSEAFVFAASFQTPEVFFLQNNQWAISVPVATQSRTSLHLRGEGFGIPSTQIDGNDVLASYAVTLRDLDAARSGGGPRFIEALTYRIGAHTTSDDPTKYRTDAELQSWIARDPIVRYEAYLRGRGESDSFFAAVEEEANDLANDVRVRTLALEKPSTDLIFDNVYSEPHPRIDEQKEWLSHYESSFGESA
ncbi:MULTISPECIES: thiamine pyrophosphate-dependent dehydrogenase E1 component subunit alpha [unclassified Frondihabitans]|uniref:thiamine pyrophosphate-dependent dehydrogenase E1 component subunit alpha n=1 Tax=unclassified Frondihabitans TaxID=2626248 RepID=UPI000700901E|nr:MULTISPECIES: thiamine pyrophosphate-dependent dehydrogenase E1 component subunit alpha [unclassified Frondihabitans]KQQ28906.1 pyruvate dehydrogenase (acetyl-transferring) E1 component subunit alpha [Frondihabitans sp. Leaf304]MBF4577222.1 thiamine pyrophosphate-dependent dehydrogenase E1 component subunit alpha [Frondihabitans sp. VKM Ac-2883]